jgi:hypothetical protein
MSIKEVDIEVPDASMLLDANSSVNFLKGSNQEDEWDQFYNDENAAYSALDANHAGAFIDVNTAKRFRPFVDLRNLPINQCLNSKIKSEHRFNYDTEASRLPTNNPEYNAALYDWQKYTSEKAGSSVLYGSAAINPLDMGVKALTAGPATVKEVYSEVELKMGELESMGGQLSGDSDSQMPLQCKDEKGGCRIYMIFQPKMDGVTLSADVLPT